MIDSGVGIVFVVRRLVLAYRDAVLLAQPAAKVRHLAALAAERTPCRIDRTLAAMDAQGFRFRYGQPAYSIDLRSNA
jgi:hypothetical protein